MAKRQKTTRFSFSSFDTKHYKSTESYVRAVDALFDAATKDITANATKCKVSDATAFKFDDFPQFKKQMQKTVDELASKLTSTIETGSRKQWLYACDKNDAFIKSIMDTSKLKKSTLNKMQDRNLDALSTFQKRKVDGMNLSSRVWRYVDQYKDQIEQALDAGLGEGRSAQQLARDVKQNLKDPNRLFRRVRDKRGNLVLSKNAKAFHPGAGVYRSSVKNAQRLTRSEINMAYRESDFQRWKLLDFVVGFEIMRSNHKPLCKCALCEQLKGQYPKEFEFKGWHPQCMCFAVPIMADEKTINDNEADELKAALRGTSYTRRQSPNTVRDVPQGFKDWVNANVDKQKSWSSTPYFVKDNFKNGRLADGLKFATTKPKRTKEQIQAIKDAWALHNQEIATIRATANSVLAEAQQYPDADIAKLKKYIDADNIRAMENATHEVEQMLADMKQKEQALSDLIPDVSTWHKQFTLTQLQSVYDSVKNKLAQWSSLPLAQQQKKLNFEIYEYFGKNMNGVQQKYSTWEVSQQSYLKELASVDYKISIQSIQSEVDMIKQWSSANGKAINVKKLLAETETAIANKEDVAIVQQKLDALRAEYDKKTAVKAKVREYNNEDFTDDRRNNAVWDTSRGALADNTLRETAGEAWLSAAWGEKDDIFDYTQHYCKTNEPLQNRHYTGGGNSSRAQFEERVNNITTYIERNKLPKDMWFQRGDDSLSAIKSRIEFMGGKMPANLQDLVGMEMQEGGFMSTSSSRGKGFAKPVIINIYAPKGTRAAYIEPISAFGSGSRRAWNGKSTQSSFSREDETLFQRGTVLRITRVQQRGNKIYIDCDVVRQELKNLKYVSDKNILGH